MTLLLLFNKAASSNPLTIGLPFDFVLGDNIPRPEFVYVGTEALNNESTQVAEESLHKYRIAEASVASNGQGRLRQLMGVAAGLVHVQGQTGWVKFDDATDPQFDAGSTFYWLVELNGKAYIGDGLSEAVYDPKKGTLKKFEVEGAGEIPQKCRLACAYRKRLVLASGTKWYMSKVGDPHDFNYFPPVQTQTDAVADSTIDKPAPDIIQALIPGFDDYLIFGCASSIYLLRGDPLAGGEFDLITDQTGMAFGNSWARDPHGAIYFFGSRGGVYRMGPGGLPESISDAVGSQDVTIQDELESINLNDYRMELEWDFERSELIVMQVPYDTESTDLVSSWRWSSKLNAWWRDKPGSASLLPFAAWAGDGDQAADRVPLVGCKDGYVRSLSDLALNDDDTPIDAYVTIGPIQSGTDQEVSMRRIRAVLASEKSGCDFEIFAGNAPDAIEIAGASWLVHSGRFEPGMNPRLPVRVRGAYLWLRLRNKNQNESFAIEEVGAALVPRGTRRAMA